MSTYLRTHFTSLRRKAKTCVARLATKHGSVSRSSEKPTKPNKKSPLSGGLDLPLASFATMEVSGQFKQVFRVIDTNGDGKISPNELSQVLLCLGSWEKSKAEVEAQVMVREMDSNGDGFVDLDEFIEALLSEDEDYNTNILREAFLIFDADKNGLISATELQKVLASLGWGKCGLDDCKRMIRGVDKDGDGFVDFDEFRSMMLGSGS